MNTRFMLALVVVTTLNVCAQQKVIPLYSGTAPGSETWNWEEKETINTPVKMRIVYNVSKPTLTVFAPEPGLSNGSAVIICPGGGFGVLNIDHEGVNVARELNKKGITAFVFKYRVAHTVTDDPWKEMMTMMSDSTVGRTTIAAVLRLAQQDLVVAMRYLREHAMALKIDSNRIGVIGFSAGGALSRWMAYDYSPITKPAFAAVIYAGIKTNANVVLPTDAPPLFIAAATDDVLLPVMQNVELYRLWITAKRSAELHLYATGGHGLRPAPANSWIYRFEEWLETLGMLKAR